MSNQKPVNMDLSRQLIEELNFAWSPGHCFYHAQRALQVLAGRGLQACYVEGYAVTTSIPAIYHAWLEVDGQIVEPTWEYLPTAEGNTLYSPVGEVESAAICAMLPDEIGHPLLECTFDTYAAFLQVCNQALAQLEAH